MIIDKINQFPKYRYNLSCHIISYYKILYIMQDLTKKKVGENPISLEKVINGKSKLISINLPAILVARGQGAIVSRKTVGDFTLTSLSDLIRQSLVAYQQGLSLAGSRIESSETKKVNVMLNEDLFSFYQSLPPKSRWEIIERSLISYLGSL